MSSSTSNVLEGMLRQASRKHMGKATARLSLLQKEQTKQRSSFQRQASLLSLVSEGSDASSAAAAAPLPWVDKTPPSTPGEGAPGDDTKSVRSDIEDCNLFANRPNGGNATWKTGFHTTALAEKELRAKALCAFDSVARGGSSIEPSEVRMALHRLGITSLMEEDIFAVTDRHDGCSDLEFPGFLQVVYKSLIRQESPDDTTLATFVALGGNANRTGVVSVAKLKKRIYEIGVPLCIDRLVRQLDSGSATHLDFADFSTLLGDE